MKICTKIAAAKKRGLEPTGGHLGPLGGAMPPMVDGRQAECQIDGTSATHVKSLEC